MNSIPDPPDRSAAELELRAHRILRSLPDRSAPASLENRVCAEIARRAAQPWWRRSYAFWPAAARSAFILAAVGSAASVVAAFFALARAAESAPAVAAIAGHFVWLEALSSIAADVKEAGGAIVGALPPVLFYGTLAIFAVGCAALAGIGAVSYRAYVDRYAP